MYKVSFLIPVYNAAAFISNCLEHIVQSELESSEYQIIAWDDGSKDNSFDILQNYAIKYPNIVVKHADNRGVAAVRKELFALAEGQYIWQCDADDYIETNNIKRIVDYAVKYDVDYCFFDYYSFDDKGRKTEQSVKFRNQIFTGFLWNKLFKAEFLRENNITFKGDLYTGDDYIFNCLVYSCAKKRKYLPIYGYNYNYNPNSLTRDKSKAIKDVRSMLHCSDYLIEKYKKSNSRKQKIYWNCQILMNFIVVIRMTLRLDDKEATSILSELQFKSNLTYGQGSFVSRMIGHPRMIEKCFLCYFVVSSKLNRLYVKIR